MGWEWLKAHIGKPGVRYISYAGLARWISALLQFGENSGEELVFCLEGTDNVARADRCLKVLYETGLIARGLHRPGFSTAVFIGLEHRRPGTYTYPREYIWHPVPIEG